ncbi:MAG TPA: alkaline phosphatase D family protein [Acidimicrobiales bacterium]|nr:alkaline phosphatase D family protein [Acidimicrobiales bacterium]
MTSSRDPWADADVDRFGIFVPAIMSAGLLFSIVTLLRDAVHGRRHRHRDRRVEIAAAATAGHVTTGASATAALEQVLRPRSAYLLTALTCIGAAMYVVIGAVGNYGRDNGYVSDIAWLLALSVITGFLLLWLGIGAGLLYARYPDTPAWATELLISTPLGQAPDSDRAGSRRRFLLGWSATVVGTTFALITLSVGSSRGAFADADERLSDTVRAWEWVDQLEGVHLLGRTEVAVAAALLIGVATLRCLPFAAAYAGAVVASLGATTLVREVIERDRPPGTIMTGLEDSYPSGHMVQSVVLAGLVPLALLVLTRSALLARVAGVLLAVAIGLGALVRVQRGLHWPTDVLGGLALGVTIVLVVRWALARPALHARCRGCPWSPTPGPAHTFVHLPDLAHGLLGLASRAVALVAIATFGILALTIGIPRNPRGESVAAPVEVWGTLGTLALLALALALSLRHPLLGAIGLAGGGLVLGALSSVAYHPLVSVAVAASFGIPAIGLWLTWQRGRTRRAIVVVAVLCALSGTSVYATAATVHDHFYGPAHPVSDTVALPVDLVEWAWSGGVRPDGFQVVARLDGDHDEAVLVVTPDAGGPVTRSEPVAVSAERVVRLEADGLAAGTDHRWSVEVDGRVDGSRGSGRTRTAASGPTDVRIAVASCARTGSSGQVFDAIRAADPDLFVHMGDFHYGDLATNDLDRYRALLERVVTAPSQAALYRAVPIAYVWDDHDYGPNDADSRSPSRDAARTGYRELVPNVAAPTGPINQAFTLGRVRVVMTDTRSAKTPDSMLGDRQLRWLLDELRSSSRTHAVVLWVNSVPWIAAEEPGRDDWGGYPEEREEILAAIRDASIENLVMVSGDAHMVALDDGTNSGGFPVLHAAALDRPGNVRGGPYSDGAFPGAGQYGLVEVDDDGGGHVEVTLSGRTWEDELLVSRTFRFAVPRPAR